MKNAVDINRIKCYNTNRKPLRLRRKDVKDMMKYEEMIALIGNMFINAYVAGDWKDLDSFRSARAYRDRLFDEVKELYAELEHESYEREQIQVELNKANKEIINLREQIRSYQSTVRKLTHCIDFDDIPDDSDKFSEQDLPFPDVDDLAPAEEVEGSDE